MSDVDQLPPARSAKRRRIRNREYMESSELSTAGQLLARMHLRPGERVLDLSCGDGTATRMAAQSVAGEAGMAAGLDPSPEKISAARAASRELHNVLFAVGEAEEIPWRDDYFNQAFLREGFERCRDPEALLREVYRVLVPGGRFHFVARLEEDDAASEGRRQLKHYGQLRCEEDYRHLLRDGGFDEIASTPLDSTLPQGHCEGTLFFRAIKPETERPQAEVEAENFE